MSMDANTAAVIILVAYLLFLGFVVWVGSRVNNDNDDA